MAITIESPDFVTYDFETLSDVSWNCTVLSFGVVSGKWADLATDDGINELIKNGKEYFFKISNQEDYGRYSVQRTIDFWKTQPEEARNRFKNQPKHDLAEFVNIFDDYCRDVNINRKTTIWCRGLDFDPVIVNSIYHQFGRELLPYHHTRLRDIRTAIESKQEDTYIPNFVEFVSEKYGLISHGALHDSIRDTLQLYYAYTKTEDEIKELYDDVGVKYEPKY